MGFVKQRALVIHGRRANTLNGLIENKRHAMHAEAMAFHKGS